MLSMESPSLHLLSQETGGHGKTKLIRQASNWTPFAGHFSLSEISNMGKKEGYPLPQGLSMNHLFTDSL